MDSPNTDGGAILYNRAVKAKLWLPTFLCKSLIIPLAIATVAAVWMSVYLCEPWAGLLINLAAGFVGTMMTVLYVDVILKRHEAAQWSSVEQRVNMRVEGLANVCISSVRSSLGVGAEILDDVIGFAADTKRRRATMTRIAEGLLTENVGNIRNLNKQGWALLSTHLQGAVSLADRLLSTFGPRLDPALTDGILNLQEVAGKMTSAFSIFPDIYGAPVESLPTKRDGSSSIPMQTALYANAEADLKLLLVAAARLLRVIESNADSPPSRK